MLDWYQEFWVNSTKTIDYSIDSLWQAGAQTNIRLRDIGLMPMPISRARAICSIICAGDILPHWRRDADVSDCTRRLSAA